jgi:hypothetical protein
MERHSIDEANAFDMLRDQARAANRKLREPGPAPSLAFNSRCSA